MAEVKVWRAKAEVKVEVEAQTEEEA